MFDCPQAQLSSFLADIFQILEIWEVNHLVNPNTSHFICLLDNGIFLCTCMAFKTLGYSCHHFYRVMTLTPIARFHIALLITVGTKSHYRKEIYQVMNLLLFQIYHQKRTIYFCHNFQARFYKCYPNRIILSRRC